MKAQLLSLIFLLLFAACIQETNDGKLSDKDYDIQGKVIHVKDGDSFVMLGKDKKKIEVRLIDIDAPELHQPYGKKAKQHLSNYIKGKTIGIIYEKKDKYGRLLADAYIDSIYLNMEMVSAGYAWHFTRFSDDEDLQEAERQARLEGKGLWADKKPIAPWDWRDQKRRN